MNHSGPIADALSRLRRDFPYWLFTHHATPASPGGTFLARRPVPVDGADEVFATAASDEQELRRRLNIQEAIAQRLAAHGRTPLARNHGGDIAVVVADLERFHPRWHIAYEITALGAAFVARRPLPPDHADLGLLETVEAPSGRALSWRLACQDAQIAAVSLAIGTGETATGRLTETVAGFEDLLRRAAGEL